uniref:Uncharacterized protein n=1 Tax=Pristionchus pacificus TaxID=54126 RepID=A0A2A6CZM9_PRIPA|eukprot:PDM83615.1 hypothetical protein PRIPAC_30102 [Pristionchus pacificus]
MAKLQWRNEQSHRRQEEGGWEDEGARYLAVVPLTALVRSTRTAGNREKEHIRCLKVYPKSFAVPRDINVFDQSWTSSDDCRMNAQVLLTRFPGINEAS